MNTILQGFALARNEFRFGLRRGAPVVVTALIGLIVGTAILLLSILNMGEEPQYDEYSPQQVQAWNEMGLTEEIFLTLVRDDTADMLALSSVEGWFFLFLALLLLPIATAGVIPADRQFGVMELLRSTPINGTIYLAGKMLGILGIVFFIAIFPFLIFFAVLEGVLLHAYQNGIPLYLISFFIKLAIMDGIPHLACGAIIGVLSGIAFRTRRAAIFPGLLAGIASVFAWTKLFQTPGIYANSIDKAAVFVFQGYQSISQASWAKIMGPDAYPFEYSLLGTDAPVVGIGQVILMYALILVTLFVLVAIARLWLLKKENF